MPAIPGYYGRIYEFALAHACPLIYITIYRSKNGQRFQRLSKQWGGYFDMVNEDECIMYIIFKAEIFNTGISEAELTLT